MDAKKMVNWNIISTVLTGNGNTVRVDRPNKKYENEINSLLDYVQDWIDRKGVIGEVKVTAIVQEFYDAEPVNMGLMDEAGHWNFGKQRISKLEIENKPPEWAKKHKQVMKTQTETMTPRDYKIVATEIEPKSTPHYVLVDSLPKDRKAMTEEGYRGLYSSGGKFYTNKVVENKLEIREWSRLEKAKEYLDNLKQTGMSKTE